MPSLRILVPVFATLFVSGAAFAADSAPPAVNSATRPAAADRAPHGCFAAYRDLSPEARIIRAQEIQKDADTLTVTKFRAARKAECDRLAAQTPEERKKNADSLQARWDALSSDEKLKLYHETLLRHDKMAHHWMNHQGGRRAFHASMYHRPHAGPQNQ